VKFLLNNMLVRKTNRKTKYLRKILACRMMNDGSCRIPCYEEDKDCNLTVVKIFLAKNSDSKDEPPILYKLNSVKWHGLYEFEFMVEMKFIDFRKWSTK
jgi:hypothetical protein